MSDTPVDLITPAAAATILRLQVRTLRGWVRAGKLPGWRIGTRVLVSEADVRACIRPVPLRPRPVVPVSERARAATDRNTMKILEKYGLGAYG